MTIIGVVVISGIIVFLLKYKRYNSDSAYGWRISQTGVTGLGAHSPSDARAGAESFIDFDTEV